MKDEDIKLLVLIMQIKSEVDQLKGMVSILKDMKLNNSDTPTNSPNKNNSKIIKNLTKNDTENAD